MENKPQKTDQDAPDKRILNLVEFLNIPAVPLAVEVGVSRSALHNILKGHIKVVSNKLALKIVNRFPNVSYRYLVTGVGSLSQTNPENQNEHQAIILNNQFEILKKLDEISKKLDK